MLTNKLRWVSVLAIAAMAPVYAGCACGKRCGVREARATTVSSVCGKKCKVRCGDSKCNVTTTAQLASADYRLGGDLPPNAQPGECYARVFIPPEFKTVTDRVCIREESERVEIVPAQYEWVEERVKIRDEIEELVEIPARYETREQVVTVDPGYTTWVHERNARCVANNNLGQQQFNDVYCLVKFPGETRTVRQDCLVEKARVEKRCIPAEYQTVRRQKLVCPATTKKVKIPAEYEEVQRRVVATPGRMEWQRVLCEIDVTAHRVNAMKSSLAAKGYKPGPANGQLQDQDWRALESFQQQKGLPVGVLTYDTMAALGVPRK